MYDEIIKKLRLFRTKLKILGILSGVCIWLILAIILVLLAVIFESTFNLNTSVRPFLDVALIMILASLFAILIFWPFIDLLVRKNSPNDVSVAKQVGSYYPSINDRLANAIQVYNKQDPDPGFMRVPKDDEAYDQEDVRKDRKTLTQS